MNKKSWGGPEGKAKKKRVGEGEGVWSLVPEAAGLVSGGGGGE